MCPYPARRSIPHRVFSWSWPLTVAISSGCGGSDGDVVTRPPGMSASGALLGTHVTFRPGTDVGNFCAARKDALTAFAVLVSGGQGLRLYTSTDPALREQSFVPGPEQPNILSLGGCALSASSSGFVLGWTALDTNGPVLQRLSNDGTPIDEPVVLGPNFGSGFRIATERERSFVARSVATETNPIGFELWVDSVEGAEVTSELIDTCAVPSTPELFPTRDGVDALYVCARDEGQELMLSRAEGGEREATALASTAALGKGLFAAIDLGDSWAAAWDSDEDFLFTRVNKETLEVSEPPLGEFSGLATSVPWAADLARWSGGFSLSANVCPPFVDEVKPCFVVLCSESEGDSMRCTRIESESEGQLLAGDERPTFSYLEPAADAGADLYTFSVSPDGSVATTPAPVLGPGRFAPRGLACDGNSCSIFGSESHTKIHGGDPNRYGFWVLDDALDPLGVAKETIVFEAHGAVIQSEMWGGDWSVGVVRGWGETAEFSLLTADGPLVTHPLPGFDEGAILAREGTDGDARYRLFEFDPTLELPEFLERTIDAAGASSARVVNGERLYPSARCGTRYLATSFTVADRVLYGYDPGVDSEFVPFMELPELEPSTAEVIACQGDRVLRLVYNNRGSELFRHEPDGTFKKWRFDELRADVYGLATPTGESFRALATSLGDDRVAFLLQTGNRPTRLSAVLVGGVGEPETAELELPDEPVLTGAVSAGWHPAGTLRLVWTEAASRRAVLSTWTLPGY